MRFAILATLLSSGCIIPFATPPIKGEIGASSRVGHEDERNSSSLHAAAGAHYASGTRDANQPFDIGAGWTYEKTSDTSSHGMYMDVAAFLDRAAHRRTSLGGRGEVRWLEGAGHAYAAKLRVDTELFTSGTSNFDSKDKCGSSSGTHVGTTAIGVFVEAGRVWQPEMQGMSLGNAWVATAGISLRIPSAIGVWVGIPGC